MELEPIIWQKEKISRFSNHGLLANMALSDSIFGFVAYDSLLKSENLYLVETKHSTPVQDEIQAEVFQPLYISPPSPVPASSFVKMKIYWDQRLDMDKVEFRA